MLVFLCVSTGNSEIEGGITLVVTFIFLLRRHRRGLGVTVYHGDSGAVQEFENSIKCCSSVLLVSLSGKRRFCMGYYIFEG